MFRRLCAVSVMLVSIPAVANAWYLTGRSMSPSSYGTIDPVGQKSIATGQSYTAKATPAAGYKISQVLVDNVSQPIPQPVGSVYSFPITYKSSPYYRNFVVTFAAQKYDITTTIDATGTGNGWIDTDPAGQTLKGLPSGTARTIVVSADSKSTIESVFINGVAQTISDTSRSSFPLTITANTAIVAKFREIHTTVYNECASCHANQGTNPGISGRFFDSRHWQSNTESGPEFQNQMNTVIDGGTVTFLGTYSDGYLNANDGYTTKENGSTVSCAYRCHFRPGMGPYTDVPGYLSNRVATATIANPSYPSFTRPGGDGCEACHDRLMTKPNYQNTCMVCHSGSKHGKVPNEFWASKHWQNNLESGPEFANQIETLVTGQNVVKTGNIVAETLNANDSYQTTENGSTVTCAYRCHFRPGMGPEQNVGTVLANGKSTGYVTYTDTTGKYGEAGKVYSRPGGDACMACHDSHGLNASAQSTCYTCHAGGNHGWSVAAFEKSTHFTGAYAKIEGIANDSCIACHNSHSLEAEFANMSTASLLKTAGTATGCQKCHTPGSTYSIFNADRTTKAPHIQTGTPDAGGFYATASYITTDGATCASCHYHNNTINADWAESGHGDLTTAAFVSNASHNWNEQGPSVSRTDKTPVNGINYQLSPQQTNCVRCHTSRGFAQFWDSGFQNIDQIRLADGTSDKASSPLTCDGCHSGARGVRGAVRPMPAGYTQVKSFYGYSTAAIAPAKMLVSLQFTNNKNSNICIPCHSQRAAGIGIKALFAKGAFKQYSVGTAMYPHEAQPAAVVDGKGGYEFASAQGYQDRMRHIRIGNYGTGTGYNNTGVTSGNCAGCHMKSADGHKFEAVTHDDITGAINGIASTTCANCHPTAFTYQDIQKKKDEFNAAVTALGKLLVAKGFTQDGVNVLPERKAFDMSLGTKDNAVAEKNIGAWFNWYLFNTADKAAYVHNPAYSRRLINDSIDWLDDHIMNDSAAGTITAQAAAGTLTSAEKSLALAQLENPGCMGCHFGTGSTLNAEAVPGVEQAPHFNTTGALVPGQTFTQAQFVVAGAQCNYCHGYGHGTDSPSYSALSGSGKAVYPQLSSGRILKDYAESAHGETNGLAWTDYNFLNLSSRSSCAPCHTTKGFVAAVDNANANGGRISATPFLGDASDTTKQVLGCNACHNSTTWKSSVRTISGGYVAGMGGYPGTASVTFADVGESNVCIPCHAGRENGDTINSITDFTNVSFKNPHYLGAAAVFYGKGGYKFYPGATDYRQYNGEGEAATWNHGRLGMNNYSSAGAAHIDGKSNATGTKGQCVACHLGQTNTHTFKASTVVNAWSDGCYGCHTGEGGVVKLIEEEKVMFDAGMAFFKWQLAKTGMYFTPNHPYFMTAASGGTAIKNWTIVGPAGGNGAQNMGSALNFKLLEAEKGAHVHNRTFARQLIYDSIQYLQYASVSKTDVTKKVDFTAYAADNPDLATTLGPYYAHGDPTAYYGVDALKKWLCNSSGFRK